MFAIYCNITCEICKELAPILLLTREIRSFIIWLNRISVETVLKSLRKSIISWASDELYNDVWDCGLARKLVSIFVKFLTLYSE